MTQSLTVQSHFWPQPGKPHPNFQVTLNKMPTSSSYQRWTKYIWHRVASRMSRAFVSFILRSRVNCRAKSNVNDVETLQPLSTLCLIFLLSWRAKVARLHLPITLLPPVWGGLSLHISIDTCGLNLLNNRFTQPEKLGQKEYSCGKCGKATHVSSTAIATESTLMLPIYYFLGGEQEVEHSKVASSSQLPIQSQSIVHCNSDLITYSALQRFEHKNNDKSSARKIDTAIRFPASLNMAPYTTLAMHSGNKGNGSSWVH